MKAICASGLWIAVLSGAGPNALAQGNFEPHQLYEVGVMPWGIAAGDFNNDGLADVAVTNSNNYGLTGLTVLYGQPGRQLGLRDDYSTTDQVDHRNQRKKNHADVK